MIKSFTYHDIVYSMTLEDNVTLLDPFAHTEQKSEKIWNFNSFREHSATEKVAIVETFCTLVTVGGKYLETKTFKKVLKKIDEIRKIIRVYFKFFCTYKYKWRFKNNLTISKKSELFLQ